MSAVRVSSLYRVRIRILEFQDWNEPPSSLDDGHDSGDNGDSNNYDWPGEEALVTVLSLAADYEVRRLCWWWWRRSVAGPWQGTHIPLSLSWWGP